MKNKAAQKTWLPNPFRCLSSKCKLVLIVAMFVIVSFMLEGMMLLQSDINNGVRAYVRGEGLWAKAQKDAVYYLNRYAAFGQENDYRNYVNILQVNLGDKQARLALQSHPPNIEQAAKGFLMGQNHPKDIDALINFFLRFQQVSYLREAIRIWTEADSLIEQLQELGEKIHHAEKTDTTKTIQLLLVDVNTLNKQLSLLENEFSLTLEEGARWIKKTIILISLALLVFMLIIVVYASSRIIKGVVKTEQDLLISDKRFHSLLRSDLLGVVVWHGNGQILDANDAFLNMLEFNRNDLETGQINWRNLTPINHSDKDNQALIELSRTGKCVPYEKELYNKKGNRIPVYLGATLLNGEREEGICFIIDIGERKRNESQLRLAAAVFESSNEGILVTDNRLRIVTMNQAFSDMTGFKNKELLGRTPKALRSGLMSDDFYKELWVSLENSGHWQGDIIDRKQDGSLLPIRLSISAVRDSSLNVSHYVAIFTDISERKAAEEQLHRLANYDYLTGLANRHLMRDRLEQAMQRAKRNKNILALLFFDLDLFKPVNDQYGHEIGDKLLQAIANQLQKTIRGSDAIARLGGDEFLILLEDLHSTDDAAEVARKVIEIINEPRIIDSHEIRVGSSIGISLYPGDSEVVEGLIKCADSAMYAAKNSGRNCFYFFNKN